MPLLTCFLMFKEKLLIIRFSSFGDVTQCLSVPTVLKTHFPGSQVHWVTREDMAPLLEKHPGIDRVWSYSRSQGRRGLFGLAKTLRQEQFTRIYDAHNNLRSHLITLFLQFPWVGMRPQLLRRSIRRWKRLLLFKFRINTFQQPFSGQRDLLEPLQAWGLSLDLPSTPQLFLESSEILNAKRGLPETFIALAPSAAFELKRWPLAHWQNLILSLPSQNFVLLGGPEDHFLEKLVASSPDRVFNLAGKTNLRQSAAVIASATALVSNDTGLLHVGEQLGRPSIALMGPAPFGFPSRLSTKILQVNLPCRPCSKHGQGPCVNPNFQQCLKDISPAQVRHELLKFLEIF